MVGKGHQISPGTPKAIYAATLLLSGVWHPHRVSTPTRKAGSARKSGKWAFSEFGWNSFKAIGFSPSLAGKDGILF